MPQSVILNFLEKKVKMEILPVLCTSYRIQRREGPGITCLYSGCRVVKGSPSLSFPRCAGWLETQKFSDLSMSKKLKKNPKHLHSMIFPVPDAVPKIVLF